MLFAAEHPGEMRRIAEFARIFAVCNHTAEANVRGITDVYRTVERFL